VNDRYGHAAGDALLVALADRLRDSVRTVDFVSRIGGDEFVILLPAISSAEATDIAKRIIARVEAPFELGLQAPVHVGISIGSACTPDDGKTADALLRSADRAMYEAKRRGKGLFMAHDAFEVEPVELAPSADADARVGSRSLAR
jgi:diguanylate cyclase